jgi:2-methylcitrate dehydratase PrpD
MTAGTPGHSGVTTLLAERIANSCYTRLAPETIVVAKQCLLDILGVMLAGIDEPLSRILLSEIDEEGGNPLASMVGTGRQGTLAQAALVNGSAGHAHDYDDVHGVMTGHPTVPVAPAVMALAEYLNATGTDVITALATGIDTECLVSSYMGPSHYAKGWHTTATVGCFGSAAASAQMLGLDADTTARALGIAGTQAAGLKSLFGSMCKPLHAGHAAATGLTAARLARKGFTSCPDVLEAEQGFGDTQSTSVSIERFRQALAVDSFVPDVCFKYHASCYLTHAAIEAAMALRQAHGIQPDEIKHVEIMVDQGHFKVCNIQEPATGLEAKFSLRFTTAMALNGLDTSGVATYTDEITRAPSLVKLRDKATVVAYPEPHLESRLSVTMQDGKTHSREANVWLPLRDLGLQWQKLETKFRALVDPILGADTAQQIITWCHNLEDWQDLREFWRMIRGNDRRPCR